MGTSGARNFFLTPVDQGTEPPAPSISPDHPPPPFVMNGTRALYPPDLCAFQSAHNETGSSKDPPKPTNAPSPSSGAPPPPPAHAAGVAVRP